MRAAEIRSAAVYSDLSSSVRRMFAGASAAHLVSVSSHRIRVLSVSPLSIVAFMILPSLRRTTERTTKRSRPHIG
jgi:hypothetical protein